MDGEHSHNSADQEQYISMDEIMARTDRLRTSATFNLRNALLGGIIAAILTITLAFGVATILNTDDLEQQAVANGRIAAASGLAERCMALLPLNPDLLSPNDKVRRAAFEEREKDVADCYSKFDALLRRTPQ